MGTNELYMVVALVGVVMWLSYTPGPLRWWPMAVLVVAVIGSVLTVAAPGNVARAAAVTHTLPWTYHLLTVGCKACYLAGAHLIGWSSNGLILLATGLGFFTNWLPLRVASHRYRLLWMGIAGVVLVVALTLPTLWLTNDVPARIWNAAYFIFLISWLCTLAAAKAWWPVPEAWQLANSHSRALRVGWLFIVLLGGSTNVHKAYVDVAFKAWQYDVSQYQRYARLQMAQHQGYHTALVPPLLPNEYQYPYTISLHELELSPQDIANEGIAAYFSLDSIRISRAPQRINGHFRE